MRNKSICLLFIGFAILNIDFFAQNIYDSNTAAIFYKKKWNRNDLPTFSDTSKTIISFNDNYNINSMLFNNLFNGQCIYEKYNYTYDSLKYCLINKEELIIHIVVYDSMKNILEEGNLKAIGPFAISQNNINYNSSKKYSYSLYYYFVKYGEWRMYNVKDKKNTEISYNLPDIINFDDILKENNILVTKRRKKFIKENHLKKDYYE